MRKALVTGLESFVDGVRRSDARRFLEGLSRDELAYIAEFMGASILDPANRAAYSREALAQIVEHFHLARKMADRPATDQDHKMILLLEFLSRTAPPYARRRSAGA